MMNKNYKNIASEEAKSKALIEQVYTCDDDVKKEFKFKNIEDLKSIKKFNDRVDILEKKVDSITNALDKIIKIITKENQ